MNSIAEIIERDGGNAAFSRLTGIPVRTVQDWKLGKRVPPGWVLPLLEIALPVLRKRAAVKNRVKNEK